MTDTAQTLAKKSCVPCTTNTRPLDATVVQTMLAIIPLWRLDNDRIRREWRVKDFPTALDFFSRIGTIADAEDHHPDLHLTNYRDIVIEIWTHAANGLTENDFILAAKIDQLPVELKLV